MQYLFGFQDDLLIDFVIGLSILAAWKSLAYYKPNSTIKFHLKPSSTSADNHWMHLSWQLVARPWAQVRLPSIHLKRTSSFAFALCSPLLFSAFCSPLFALALRSRPKLADELADNLTISMLPVRTCCSKSLSAKPVGLRAWIWLLINMLAINLKSLIAPLAPGNIYLRLPVIAGARYQQEGAGVQKL